jgi:hypothetical protein
MKDLMNKVREAKKAAEANAIPRREKTAVIRSQAPILPSFLLKNRLSFGCGNHTL